MDVKEEKLKELKEIRRGNGIVFLAVLTFLGTLLDKYLQNSENFLYKKAFLVNLMVFVILLMVLILIPIPIWRIIKNG